MQNSLLSPLLFASAVIFARLPRIVPSVATVRFSSVQTLIMPNLELNLPELVQEVQFRFSGGSNPELNLEKL
jgi:hypothetical protein